MPKKTHRKLSLIEILMIASLLAVLFSIGIVAVNPVNHFAEAKNALRWSHVNALANAIYQYGTVNNGNPPAGVELVPREICNMKVSASECASHSFIDLSSLMPTYISVLPTDPFSEGTMGSGYSVAVDAAGKITVAALHAENGDIVSVSR